jgi:drug/metabolite transporter (DMT)-like permease
MGALLALLAAVIYGVGDFVGGFGGRKVPAALVPIPMQAVGVLTAALAILSGFSGQPTAAVLAWGAIGGIGSGVGNAALIRGLAGGRMSVVAPLSAVLTAALPSVVGVLTGDRLALSAWLGIALAFPAIALTSSGDDAAGGTWRDIAYGALAGCGFGLLFVALDRAGTDAGAWPLLPGQIVALALAAAFATPEIRRLRRDGGRVQFGPALRWGAAAGALGATANLLFLIATSHAQLTVLAVLVSLYPAVTVVLAAGVLRERIHRLQALGLLASAVAIALIVSAT